MTECKHDWKEIRWRNTESWLCFFWISNYEGTYHVCTHCDKTVGRMVKE